ncbi:MAG TPA: sigma-70 family RNA polymerase sigma factor [Bacillales bacterium]|nr:sigma-70 family RNA polymerase sigma factor [Bacillales bacterium]
MGKELLEVRGFKSDDGRDKGLVDRARSGDREAFGELVRRHRAKAYGWASTLANDAHLADDIVQDALIGAFLHVGELMDSDRFVPWFHRIVRNQAYMKLRRGGQYGKESPFSALEEQNGSESSDIDRILFQLTVSVDADESLDPAVRLVKKEMIRGIHELLHCLSQRERSVFEAFFFQQLSPIEIAQLFQTQTGNVYNILSRSRRKVQRERIRVHLNGFVRRRKEQKFPSKKTLAKPIEFFQGEESR